MLDRIFGRAAAGADAGFLLRELGIARGPQHLVDGGRHMIVGEIMRMGPGDALVRLRLGIVGEISGEALEGLACANDANDHRGTSRNNVANILEQGLKIGGQRIAGSMQVPHHLVQIIPEPRPAARRSSRSAIVRRARGLILAVRL